MAAGSGRYDTSAATWTNHTLWRGAVWLWCGRCTPILGIMRSQCNTRTHAGPHNATHARTQAPTTQHTHARRRTQTSRQAAREGEMERHPLLSGDTAPSDSFKSFSALKVQLVKPHPFLAPLPTGLSITRPGPVTAWDTHARTYTLTHKTTCTLLLVHHASIEMDTRTGPHTPSMSIEICKYLVLYTSAHTNHTLSAHTISLFPHTHTCADPHRNIPTKHVQQPRSSIHTCKNPVPHTHTTLQHTHTNTHTHLQQKCS